MVRWCACRRIQDYGCGQTISLVNIVPIFHLVANDIFLVFDVSEAERVFHNAACFRKVNHFCQLFWFPSFSTLAPGSLVDGLSC